MLHKNQALALQGGEGLIEKRTAFRAANEPEFKPVPGIAELASMWPGGRKAFLAELDIGLREFNAWADGRGELRPAAVRAVLARAHVRSESGQNALGGGGLLVASRAKPLCQLYAAVTQGGPICLSREVVSPEGRPSGWRFLLFQRAEAQPCIVLVQPGSAAGDMLSPRHLPNFGGPALATQAVWNSVQFIVRNHEDLRSPGTVATEFEAMHGAWMQSLHRAWQRQEH